MRDLKAPVRTLNVRTFVFAGGEVHGPGREVNRSGSRGGRMTVQVNRLQFGTLRRRRSLSVKSRNDGRRLRQGTEELRHGPREFAAEVRIESHVVGTTGSRAGTEAVMPVQDQAASRYHSSACFHLQTKIHNQLSIA